MRIRMTLVALGAVGVVVLASGLQVLAGSGTEYRYAGTVVAVDLKARAVTLVELREHAKVEKLTVPIAPQARVILSERLPDDQVTDLRHPFKDTPISLSDLRPGDFVVLELTEESGKRRVANAVVVTFRRR